MIEGPCADSEEKHEPVSGVDIAVAVSLKVLDLDGRLEKRTCADHFAMLAFGPISDMRRRAGNVMLYFTAPPRFAARGHPL